MEKSKMEEMLEAMTEEQKEVLSSWMAQIINKHDLAWIQSMRNSKIKERFVQRSIDRYLAATGRPDRKSKK